MTLTFDLLFLVLSLVCFILATVNMPSRINLTSAGLACFILTLIF